MFLLLFLFVYLTQEVCVYTENFADKIRELFLPLDSTDQGAYCSGGDPNWIELEASYAQMSSLLNLHMRNYRLVQISTKEPGGSCVSDNNDQFVLHSFAYDKPHDDGARKLLASHTITFNFVEFNYYSLPMSEVRNMTTWYLDLYVNDTGTLPTTCQVQWQGYLNKSSICGINSVVNKLGDKNLEEGLVVLRKFRDLGLVNHKIGRKITQVYYKNFSPYLVKVYEKYPVLVHFSYFPLHVLIFFMRFVVKFL